MPQVLLMLRGPPESAGHNLVNVDVVFLANVCYRLIVGIILGIECVTQMFVKLLHCIQIAVNWKPKETQSCALLNLFLSEVALDCMIASVSPDPQPTHQVITFFTVLPRQVVVTSLVSCADKT